jgi:transcription antitermination factor NusG
VDVEVFLPRIRQEETLFGKTRMVTKSLFPNYLFARFCPLINYDAIRYAEGIVRIVGPGSSPIPIAAEIIATIRSRLEVDGYIRLRQEPFQPGDKVKIEEGPFAGWMGLVEREWNDGRRVLILLQTIQQARLLVDRQALVRRCDD